MRGSCASLLGVQPETFPPGAVQDPVRAVCYTDRVHSKRLQVWKVWEEIQQLQSQMRVEMVPVVTTTATQRAIHDSKVLDEHTRENGPLCAPPPNRACPIPP